MLDSLLPSLEDIFGFVVVGETDMAKAALRNILSRTGEVALALERQARLAEQRGEWGRALALWAEMAREEPEQCMPVICQADIYRGLGDFPRAREVLRQLPVATSGNTEVLQCRLRLAQTDRAWDDAMDLLGKLRALGSDPLDVDIRAVDILTEQQNLEAAEDILFALPAHLAGHPMVCERRARILALRSDWDACYDGLRPLLFMAEPFDWVVHQTIWTLVELRRFDVLHQLRTELSKSGSNDSRIKAHLQRADIIESEFHEATKNFLSNWTPVGTNVGAMVSKVREIIAQDVAVGDAGAWHLYSCYPNDFDVLCLMAEPPLVHLAQHRAPYFQRLIYLRYPRSEYSLFLYAQSLYGCKQYGEIVQLIHQFGIERVTDARLLQLALTAEDIIAADPAIRNTSIAQNITNPDFKQAFNERKRHIRHTESQQSQTANKPPRILQKPRIALCISGQLRGYQECFPSVRHHIVNQFTTDVFVQTWAKVGNAEGAHGGRLHRLLPAELAKEIPDHWSDENFFSFYPNAASVLTSTIHITQEELSKELSPAKCHIADEAEFETMAREMEGADQRSIMNQYKLFYQMSQCLERAGITEPDADTRYDLVVWMRPDIRIPRFHWVPLIEACIDNDFVVSSFLPPLGVGDFIIIGTPANMRILAALWQQLKERNSFRDDRFCRQGLGPTLLANYFFQNAVKVKHTDMFVCGDEMPHGAKPNALQLLRAMLRDAVARREWLQFEVRALATLLKVCIAPNPSEENKNLLQKTLCSLMETYPESKTHLMLVTKTAGLEVN